MEQPPIITYAILALTVIVAIIGGVVVIVQPETMDFKEYTDTLKNFAYALGIVGVARALPAAAKKLPRRADDVS